jgi:macrolide-specific efflux system membrane fusion protein
VRIGLDNKVTAQVLSGVQPGDKVVVGQSNGVSAPQAGPPGGPGGGPGGGPRGVIVRGP